MAPFILCTQHSALLCVYRVSYNIQSIFSFHCFFITLSPPLPPLILLLFVRIVREIRDWTHCFTRFTHNVIRGWATLFFFFFFEGGEVYEYEGIVFCFCSRRYGWRESRRDVGHLRYVFTSLPQHFYFYFFFFFWFCFFPLFFSLAHIITGISFGLFWLLFLSSLMMRKCGRHIADF